LSFRTGTTKIKNGMQNLTIDYSTDTNGRILSMNYNETGGFNGNLTYVYDNYGNVADLLKDDGNPAKAILINPNNGAINKRYNPHSIDDPFTYRVRDGFMSIGDLWANGDGTVYIKGHPVIPNPWGNVSTNGTTTTTTTDKTEKGGGDDVEPCMGGCPGGTVLCCLPPTEDQVNIECGKYVGIAYDECVAEMYEKWMREKRNCTCLPPPCNVAY